MVSVPISLFTPTLALSFSPAAPTTAQNVVVTANVTGVGSNPTPTGSVAVTYGAPTGGFGQLSGGTTTITVPAGVLPAGSNTFSATYTPDYTGGLYYAGATASGSITVTGVPKSTPTITTTPSLSAITLADGFTIAVQVAGTASGSPAATGSGTITANGQSQPFYLTAGKGQISINPGSLPVGTSSLTINYLGDSNYNPVATTLSVTVGKAVTSLTILPNPSSVNTAQSLQVIVNLIGVVSGTVPTGTVTLTSGSYNSGPQSMGFPMNIIVPAGTLQAGTDTLTATYTGDSNYTSATVTGSVVITTPPPPPPIYTMSASTVTISAPGATTGNTSTVTITPANGFTGNIALTASVASGPSGAEDPPTLSFGSTTPVDITGTAAGTAILTVGTTAASTGALVPPHRPGSRWLPLGETAVAGILLFGFRKRRAWRSIAGSMLLLAALSSAVAACGGGGGGGGTTTPPPVTNPGTTAGTYVVTINATSPNLNSSTTVNVVVQ
jgi:hypothetical protein